MARAALQEIDELLDGQARLPNDGAESATIQFVVVRHADRRPWIIAAHEHMAPPLTHHDKADPRQRRNAPAAGDVR